MTLIVPIGDNSLPCISDGDDADSGCLARSPDDITKEDFSDECVTSSLNRHAPSGNLDDETEKDVKGDTSVPPNKNLDKNINEITDKIEQPSNLKKSELKISLNCDKEVSKTSPLVIYECKITVDSIPKYSVSNNQSTKVFKNSISENVSGENEKPPIQKNKSLASTNNYDSRLRKSTDESKIINMKTQTLNTESDKCENLKPETKPIVTDTDTKFSNSHSRKDTNTKLSLITSSKNFINYQNKVSIPNVKNILSSVPNEEQKIKLKKLMQRRSISESSSNDNDFGYLKKTRDKLRHSFSAYENCDKLHKILDKTLINSKDTVYENERLNNDVNDVLSNENSLENINTICLKSNASLEKISRKSCIEINDTLVDNVKKSMIEEYKNLKKNSSLANQNANENPSEILQNLPPNQSQSEGYHINAREAFENNDINKTETKNQAPVSPRNMTPTLDIRTRTISEVEHSSSSSVGVQSASEFQRSKSYPSTDDNSDVLKKEFKVNNIDAISSPPTRLETWKNILAEKRNSIRNHIKGFSKLTENNTKSNNNTDKLKEPVLVKENDISNLNKNNFIENALNGNNIPIREKNDSDQVIANNKDSLPNIKSYNNLPIVDDIINKKYRQIDNNNIEKEKKTCNNFICVNSLHILHCVNESQKENESKIKSKLQEACQGIAKALDTLPEARETKDSMNNNELVSNAMQGHSENVMSPQKVISKDHPVKCKKDSSNTNNRCMNSNIVSIITTIPPPIYVELASNEKSQQCPTPPAYFSDDEVVIKRKNASTSSEDDSDYCQTDECGDDCDYCSGDEAEDEEDDTCDMCRRNRSLSPVCKHTRVMTNGSLRSLRNHGLHEDCGNQKISGSRSLVLQAALRRRHINHQELSAIREYSITSDDQQDSDEEQSHDDSMCDISSSWRYGLCEDHVPSSIESTLKSEKSKETLSAEDLIKLAKLKSNSLPASPPRPQLGAELPRRPGSVILKHTSNSEDEGVGNLSGVRLPPRPPRNNRTRHPLMSISFPGSNASTSPPLNNNLRPAMGLQGLQQRPSSSKVSHASGIPTGPKTLAPRSPINPNPPFGFPNPPSPPSGSPASPFQGRKNHLEAPPSSPRTNSRSGALVTRNFSISDDEGGQRLSRRQVTITRHESAYKEAAHKGYLLPASSPIDPYWLTWKLGVLQKTVEDVGMRLGESEKTVGAWGPIAQDQNIADQQVHNIRKFRESLPDLQRGIDDVNDQAARFSAHNVPLTPANSAALHDLNNRWKNLETTVNDRWRQLAGRSREVTPLTPAQLASSVCPPWERATATNKVPYYINHAQETTHWDHPQMMDLLDSLSEFNHIKFSAYRTATKLRSLQKKLSLDRAKLQMVTDVFDEHGLRGQNDRLIDVNDMVVVLSTLYGRISSDNTDVNTTLATDLCLNWLLNVYDSQRTGQMRVLSFRVGLICLCRGHLEEKYRYMFRLIADPNRLVDQRKLGLLLHDCVQVPRQLGEVAAFGGSNIEPSVRSCFTKAGKDRETIEAVHFLTWVQQEPQSLVWLAVLHRVAASESVQHQVKCNICKTYPILGLRYRCLKCLSFDMCQRCFFEGRSSKSHKITHPMHEYCTATTAGDEMKDFTKALKNKFKSKRSLQKHTKKGYLPVQTVLEGDPLESPSPSPSHNVSSQDMHSRLELYASRLAEVELRTNSNSTPDSIFPSYSEDEHGLIAQYCQSLSSSDAPFPVPKSPLQIMASVDADQKDELEQMIRDLEEENRALQAEYERLKSEQPSGSVLDEAFGQRSEAEMVAEAKLLREHKGRLEARMSILEDHNRQLEAQLQRLRQLLVEQQSGIGSPNKSGTLQTKSVTASQLAMDSPAKINGHSSQGGSGSAYDGLDQMSEYVRPPPPPVGSIAHMGNLFSRAGDLEKAVGSLVATMNQEKESDSHSDHSDENDYDNTGPSAVQ